MMTLHSDTTARRPLWSVRPIARDYAFVMPGFFISVVAFVLLLPLAVLSIGTLIIWVGALLLPLTLQLASMFAELSRARLRLWGVALPPAEYPSGGRGIAGVLQRMSQPRRWLDLVFETLVAFPLRTFTFVVATAWSAGAVGGVTYGLWSTFLPQDNDSGVGLLIEVVSNGAVPDSFTQSAALDIASTTIFGFVFLLTLPLVMRGLARLDAVVTTAALGGSPKLFNRARQEPRSEARPSHNPQSSVSRHGWGWIAAVFAAIAALAINWPVLGALYEAPVVFAMLVSFAHMLALLCIMRWPGVAIAAQTAAVAATTVISSGQVGSPWPWPVMTLILQAILVILITLRHRWQWAVALWLLPQLAALLTVLPFGITPGAETNLIITPSITLGVLILTLILRQLITSRGDLRAERQTSAALSTQQKELKERNRIAQELHDVVAHSMSVVSVQSTTAKYRIPTLDDAAEREFQSIAESSRQALTEMRSLLSLLRSTDDGDGAPLSPQPTLTDLPGLIEASRRSGAQITLYMSRPGDPTALSLDAESAPAPAAPGREASVSEAPVPAATGLTAYRIVQEALSNAMRHSPGAEIAVAVTTDDAAVTIEVTNGPADAESTLPEAPGAGLGLAGVRERTIALGGSVETGQTNDGGYKLWAILPLE